MNNNIEQSVEPLIYSSGNRQDMNTYEINQALRIKSGLEGIYKLMPTIPFNSLKVGQEVGLAYSANNSQYYVNAIVTVVNPKSARVRAVNGYHTFNMNKATIKNRIFDYMAFTHICDELNELERAIDDYFRGKINEFWKERIEKAEQEHKEQGVYKMGETWLIDQHGFNKVKDNWEISV